MVNYEMMKSLEGEGFVLDYPDISSTEDKIIFLLREKESRLHLAIPLLIEKGFDYKKIAKRLGVLKDGKFLLNLFNKIILITLEIFKKTKRNTLELRDIIEENKIRGEFTQKELEYYFEEYKLSKNTIERKNLDAENLEKRKGADSFKALEKIFSPAKIRILRKIYQFKSLTPSEKTYYYRDIKSLIDAILNKNLQEYLQIVLGNRRKG